MNKTTRYVHVVKANEQYELIKKNYNPLSKHKFSIYLILNETDSKCCKADIVNHLLNVDQVSSYSTVLADLDYNLTQLIDQKVIKRIPAKYSISASIPVLEPDEDWVIHYPEIVEKLIKEPPEPIDWSKEKSIINMTANLFNVHPSTLSHEFESLRWSINKTKEQLPNQLLAMLILFYLEPVLTGNQETFYRLLKQVKANQICKLKESKHYTQRLLKDSELNKITPIKQAAFIAA